jgi:hypothetical protein
MKGWCIPATQSVKTQQSRTTLETQIREWVNCPLVSMGIPWASYQLLFCKVSCTKSFYLENLGSKSKKHIGHSCFLTTFRVRWFATRNPRGTRSTVGHCFQSPRLQRQKVMYTSSHLNLPLLARRKHRPKRWGNLLKGIQSVLWQNRF